MAIGYWLLAISYCYAGDTINILNVNINIDDKSGGLDSAKIVIPNGTVIKQEKDGFYFSFKFPLINNHPLHTNITGLGTNLKGYDIKFGRYSAKLYILSTEIKYKGQYMNKSFPMESGNCPNHYSTWNKIKISLAKGKEECGFKSTIYYVNNPTIMDNNIIAYLRINDYESLDNGTYSTQITSDPLILIPNKTTWNAYKIKGFFNITLNKKRSLTKLEIKPANITMNVMKINNKYEGFGNGNISLTGSFMPLDKVKFKVTTTNDFKLKKNGATTTQRVNGNGQIPYSITIETPSGSKHKYTKNDEESEFYVMHQNMLTGRYSVHFSENSSGLASGTYQDTATIIASIDLNQGSASTSKTTH